MDAGPRSFRQPEGESAEENGAPEDLLLPDGLSASTLSGLDKIGKDLAHDLEKGDKREAFRRFELALAKHFSAIVLGNAGTQVKGYIDALLTIEEYRSRKSPDMDDKRKTAQEMIEAWFTVPDGKEE